MNYKNKVFNKLFTKEVELSKEAVDLAGVADLKKSFSEINKLSGGLSKARLNADKALGLLFSTVRDGEADIKKAKGFLKEFGAAAKELGVKPNTIKDYTELKDIVDFISGHLTETSKKYLNR